MAAAINDSGDILYEYFDNAAVATFIVSPDHRVAFWNRACERLTGLSAGEVLATNNHWKPFYREARPCLADIVIDGDYSVLPDLYDTYGRSKLSESGLHAEGWFTDLGGEDRYIIFDAVPVYNVSGELVAAIETLHDITGVKRKEIEKERLVAEFRAFAAGNEALEGVIPICSSCKGIRNKEGAWMTLEEYFGARADLRFTHSLCPECARKLYPDL